MHPAGRRIVASCCTVSIAPPQRCGALTGHGSNPKVALKTSRKSAVSGPPRRRPGERVDELFRHRSDRLHRPLSGANAAAARQRDGVRARASPLDGQARRARRVLGPKAAAARHRDPAAIWRQPLLGVAKRDVTKLKGKIRHLFHLGAVYDIEASAEAMRNGQHRRHRARARFRARGRRAAAFTT